MTTEAQALVAKQAEDAGLWFNAKTAPEAYLQSALRELHAAVEKEVTSLLEQALTALEYHVAQTRPIERTTQAIEALRSALKETP